MKKRIVITLSNGSTRDFDGDNVIAVPDCETGALIVRDGAEVLGTFIRSEYSEIKIVPVGSGA